MCTDKLWFLQQIDTQPHMYTQQHAYTCYSMFQRTLANRRVQGVWARYASNGFGEDHGANVLQRLMATGLLLSCACTHMFVKSLGRNMHPTLLGNNSHVPSNLSPYCICVLVACDNMETMPGTPVQNGNPVQGNGDPQS